MKLGIAQTEVSNSALCLIPLRQRMREEFDRLYPLLPSLPPSSVPTTVEFRILELWFGDLLLRYLHFTDVDAEAVMGSEGRLPDGRCSWLGDIYLSPFGLCI